jgi:hypothetical protein
MKFSAALMIFALFVPVQASAICVVAPLDEGIAAARSVFIATITSATLDTSLYGLKGNALFKVRYTFVVVKRIKGDPTIVSSLTTSGSFIDPASTHLDGPAEQDRFMPGDSVLVVADTPGDVQLSSNYCRLSRPWDINTYHLTRSIPGFAP